MSEPNEPCQDCEILQDEIDSRTEENEKLLEVIDDIETIIYNFRRK